MVIHGVMGVTNSGKSVGWHFCGGTVSHIFKLDKNQPIS